MGIIKEYCCEAQETTPYCSIEPKLSKEKSVYILRLVWKLFVHTAKYHKGGIIVKVNVHHSGLNPIGLFLTALYQPQLFLLSH